MTPSRGSPVPFNNAIAPGPKDFDFYLTQVSFSEERAQAVDLSDGYYDVAQAVVAAKDSKLAKVTTISGLKDFQFGAQVGTTSLTTINSVIAPSKEAKIYDTNDLAIAALQNGQIDGLVVDLPTALIITAVQFSDGVVAGAVPGAGGRRALQRRPGQGQHAHRLREQGHRPDDRLGRARADHDGGDVDERRGTGLPALTLRTR